MSELKYTLDPVGRRDFENWHEAPLKGCTIINKGTDYLEITEVANDLFVLDNFISKTDCDAIIARMEKNPEEHYVGASGATHIEKETGAEPWKSDSTDWKLSTRGRNDGGEAKDLDVMLAEKFRKFFIDLDNHYCKHPYTEEPQNWDSFQAGEYAGLGNTFRLAEDEGFQIQKTDEGGYYKWHFDTSNGSAKGWKRVFSLGLYLNDDYKGGETAFARQNIKIRPRAGRLVVFYSDFTHLHAGLPVKEGTKYLLFSSYYRR